MRARLTFGVGEFARSMDGKYVPVSEAGLAAIQEIGEKVKRDGRAQIAAAGFSLRWQNALRVNIYKPGQTKVAGELAAAWVYHAIPYAGVFERGATVNAKMWVPLPWAPKKIGRRRMSPDAFVATANRSLFPIRRGGKTYLATSIAMSGRAAKSGLASKYSSTALRRGRTGRGDGAVRRLVPLFVSVSSVTFKKRLSLLNVVERAANTLAEAYFRHYKDDA